MSAAESAEPAALPASGVPTRYDALLAEHDALKAKTRDWQAKVRDRDLKMRQQLLQTTTDIQDRDRQLDTSAKRIVALEQELGLVAQLRAQVAALEATSHAAVADATRLMKAAMDEELAERQREIVKLRAAVTAAAERLDAEQRRASGLALVELLARRGPGAVRAVLRVQVPEYGAYALCVPTFSASAAAGASASSAGSVSDVPVWVSETATHAAPADQQQRWAAMLAGTPLADDVAARKADAAVAQLRGAHDVLLQRMTAEHAALVTAKDTRIATLAADVALAAEKLSSAEKRHIDALDHLKASHASAAAQLSAEAGAKVRQAVEDEKGRQAQQLAQLASQVRSLEEYKARAQLAMKAKQCTGGAAVGGPLPLAEAAAVAATAAASAPQSQQCVADLEAAVQQLTAQLAVAGREREDMRRGQAAAAAQLQLAQEAADLEKKELARKQQQQGEVLCVASAASSERHAAAAAVVAASIQSAAAAIAEQHRLEAAQLLRGLEAAVAQLLRGAWAAAGPSSSLPSVGAAAASKQMVHHGSMHGQHMVLAQAVRSDVPASFAVDVAAPAAAAPVAKGAGSGGFDFADMLEAHNHDLAISSSRSYNNGQHSPSRRNSNAGTHATGGTGGGDRSATPSGGGSTSSGPPMGEDLPPPGDALSGGGGGGLLVTMLRREVRQLQAQLHLAHDELRDAALTERRSLDQCALLKETIRELERTIAREDSGLLSERADYAKNVILRLLMCKDITLRRSLVPVVAEVLQLSPAERHALASQI